MTQAQKDQALTQQQHHEKAAEYHEQASKLHKEAVNHITKLVTKKLQHTMPSSDA
jgi:hypothetical protein